MVNLCASTFKICCLLQLFLMTVTLESCSDYAAISVEHTPSLQGEDVFRLSRPLLNGYDFASEIIFSRRMFERLINCLSTRASARPCMILIALKTTKIQTYIYEATVGQTNNYRGDNMICENGSCGEFECLLPDSFSTNRSINCKKQANSLECFNNSNICSSLTVKTNGSFQPVYNVIWRSIGELTLSYNTSFVSVDTCSNDTSQTTDTSLSTADSDNTAIIVGVVCVILVIIVLIVVFVICWRRRKASKARGRQHCEGTSSSVALAALDQTNSSSEIAGISLSRNAYSTVDKDYSSPYEQLDKSDIGYSAVHTDKVRGKDENKKHDRGKYTPKPDAGPFSTLNQHLPGEAASAEDRTSHNNEPGHEYSRLHENKRNFTNPYNEVLKPVEDPKQRAPIPPLDASPDGLSNETSGTYSLAKLEKVSTSNEGDSADLPIKAHNTQQPGDKPVQKFKLTESTESPVETKGSNNADDNKHKYFVLEKEDGATGTDDAESKGRGHNYFILEKENDNSE